MAMGEIPSHIPAMVTATAMIHMGTAMIPTVTIMIHTAIAMIPPKGGDHPSLCMEYSCTF